MSKAQLEQFRKILLEKRAQVLGDVTEMENEALGGRSGALSSFPQHLADQGSDEYDQSLALGLAASQRKLLAEIDLALERIDNGTYGICELLGVPISRKRLEATPWARLSLDGANRMGGTARGEAPRELSAAPTVFLYDAYPGGIGFSEPLFGMHEALFDDSFLAGTGVSTLDFAKAMIDEGYHPMTMYFPLVVHGAMLVEPTDTSQSIDLEDRDRLVREFIKAFNGYAESGNVPVKVTASESEVA